MGRRMVDRLSRLLVRLPVRCNSSNCISQDPARLREATESVGSAQWRQGCIASVHKDARNSQGAHVAGEESNISISQSGWRE